MTFPSYAFNASAIGLGGVIRKGNRTTVIPTVASVCLASAGGEASNRVENYDRDGISFTLAETRVAGYVSSSGIRSTYSEALLLNLKIFDRISIARMQAIVASKREITSDDPLVECGPDKTKFWIKVLYHGVEIDGQELDPETLADFCPNDDIGINYDKFAQVLKAKQQILEPHQDTITLIDEGHTLPSLPPVSGPIVKFNGNSSIVLEKQSNRVKVPVFGKASFGDAVVKPDRQRVSLLRLSLDSLWIPSTPGFNLSDASLATQESDGVVGIAGDGDGNGGSVSSGDSGSNGVPIYP